ncbi:ABC transporter ATP-binding protein [Carnobacterium maltaromaticum]|uniref:ABC transporter ATP-binding protein n=1 Tax=Carnobacterium maltaromaticum TaxID=2751 RepID=UPI00295EC5E6|nr:ABC transporter ATP-binding protein [Carnobacterium maltaromaticum]
MDKIISVKDLTISFNLKQGKQIRTLKAVDQVSLDIQRGEMLGIIGESGSGKSTLAFGILNLVEAPGRITSGEVHFINGTSQQPSIDLLKIDTKNQNKYRWEEIATVFQAAQSALNPIITVWEHFYETWQAHRDAKELAVEQVRQKVEELVHYVRLDVAVLEMYPFELSGGMKQRVLIALSLLLDPSVIILDEPTTALDVITQWYILEILKKINREKGITIIFLTHDISIISSMVDRIVVMYAGQIVEIGKTIDVYKNPSHPYTKALLEAIPTLTDDISTRKAIKGNTVNMLELDGTCRFKNRCIKTELVGCDGGSDKCQELFTVEASHEARCLFATEKGGESDARS